MTLKLNDLSELAKFLTTQSVARSLSATGELLVLGISIYPSRHRHYQQTPHVFDKEFLPCDAYA